MTAPRLLLVGNSQLGCLKLALDRWPQALAGYSVDFMPINQQWTADLEIADGWLRPARETAGRALVPSPHTTGEAFIAGYRAVAIVGLGATLMHLGLIYHRHRLLMHRDPSKQLISRPAFDAAVAEALLRSGAGLMARLIRAASAVPMLLVPEPLPNQAVTADQEEWGDVWTGPHLDFLHSAFRRHMTAIFAASGVDILRQSEQTIVDGHFTNPAYGRGAVNIYLPRAGQGDETNLRYKAYRKTDRRHMNEAYGRLAVDGINAWLAALPAGDQGSNG